MKQIQTPDQWMFQDRHDLDYPYNRKLGAAFDQIKFSEQVYRDLDQHAVDGLRRVLKGGPKAHKLEDVRKMDSGTVELIYYNDGETELSDYTVEKIRDTIQDLFGELWCVRRKPDGRRNDGENIQRLIVRRLVAQRFRYIGESVEDYERMVHGTPEGVPEDAREWQDVDHIGERPDGMSRLIDLFVWETSTGTQHLVRGWNDYGADFEGLRRLHVTQDGKTECGHSIPPETLADPDALEHYGEIVAEKAFEAGGLDPQSVLDGLCQSCLRSFGETVTDDDGNIERIEPRHHRWDELPQYREEL